MYLWRDLGVNSWPTFAVVGPNGQLLAQISGEGHRKVDLLSIVLDSAPFFSTFLNVVHGYGFICNDKDCFLVCTSS